MTQRGRISLGVALAIAALIAIHSRAADAQECCLCDCGKFNFVCIGLSSDCAADCFQRSCNFENASSCPGGAADCDGSCQAVCATETPTSTPTQTPTATPVPPLGSCTETAQCAPGLACQNNICTALAPAPATSRTGLLVILGALAAIGVLALKSRA